LEEDGLVSLSNPEERLSRLPSHVAYWFGWFAFNPSTTAFNPSTTVFDPSTTVSGPE